MKRAVLLASAAVAASFCLTGAAAAQNLVLAANDLSRLSIEDLAEIEVTSVSKRPESLAEAPAAIYVLTGDDIRRSGVQTLPEALQLAPNLAVMRISAFDYSIAARGFSGFEAANKLLVLIDGRSVYTPLYSGVDWDQHHMVLDDIERIEVANGPGGSLWGANAVNGVVNVRTKSAYDTQGLLATATAGTLDSDVALRFGGQIGGGPAWRVYATGYNRGDLNLASGADAGDGWQGLQAGFRADWARGRDFFTLQGDLADNTLDGPDQGFVRTANVLGRWTRSFDSGASLELQGYYDRSRRKARLITDDLDTWDIDAQFSFAPGRRHHVIVGGGFRWYKDEFGALVGLPLLDPLARDTSIGNVFIQDEIALREDLSLTLGVKWEDNSYTGAEWMPNARLGWRFADGQLVWASVSRAVRNPSRIERDFSIPGLVAPGFMQPEYLLAYELGYRSQPFDNASVSVSLFYHDYDDLRTNDLAPGGMLPITVRNTMTAKSVGAEVAATWDVTERWRLTGGFSILSKDLDLKPGSLDIAAYEAGGVDPKGWIKLRSEYAITDTLDLDVRLRYYAEAPTLALVDYSGAPAYAEADARLSWRVRPNLELSLVGQNLLDSQHPEASEKRRTEVPRSVHAGLRWTY